MGRYKNTKEMHWNPDNYPDHAARLVARYGLPALTDGNELLSKERPLRDGEGDEPAGQP
jgi:hypothetical protein